MYKVGRSRTPQGVRGLKLINTGEGYSLRKSHSARSAWIETVRTVIINEEPWVALRKECVD